MLLELVQRLRIHRDEVRVVADALADLEPRRRCAVLHGEIANGEVLDRIDRAARDDLVLAADRVRRDVGELLERRERRALPFDDHLRILRRRRQREIRGRLLLDARHQVRRLEEPEHVGEVRQHHDQAERARAHHREHRGARHELVVQRERQRHADHARHDVVRHHADVATVAQEHLGDAGVALGGELDEERDDGDHDAEHGGGHAGEPR